MEWLVEILHLEWGDEEPTNLNEHCFWVIVVEYFEEFLWGFVGFFAGIFQDFYSVLWNFCRVLWGILQGLAGFLQSILWVFCGIFAGFYWFLLWFFSIFVGFLWSFVGFSWEFCGIKVSEFQRSIIVWLWLPLVIPSNHILSIWISGWLCLTNQDEAWKPWGSLRITLGKFGNFLKLHNIIISHTSEEDTMFTLHHHL